MAKAPTPVADVPAADTANTYPDTAVAAPALNLFAMETVPLTKLNAITQRTMTEFHAETQAAHAAARLAIDAAFGQQLDATPTQLPLVPIPVAKKAG